jgi:nucleoside-diphosphate-sugar epimerase/intein/homing endonuclease
MRILITGGAGFIGSHLADRMLAEGHDVIAMDNLVTGSMANIAHLAEHPHFQFVMHDVTRFIPLEGSLDAVLHLASLPSPVDYLEKPIQTLKVGALGTHNALGLALAKRARFLLASTSEVYGDPLVHPQPETYWGNVNPVGPRGVYDESKRFAESLTMAYHRAHGVQTHIARIFNSVLADETLCFCNDDSLHLETAASYATTLQPDPLFRPHHLLVPAFDPASGQISLHEASALIEIDSQHKDAYEIRTRYGRAIRVTGGHSLFRRGKDGRPVTTPVRELRVGDHVAIPGRLPVVERDVTTINVGEWLIQHAETPESLWRVTLVSPALRNLVAEQRPNIEDILLSSGRFSGSRSPRNTVGCSVRKYIRDGILPLYVIARWQEEGSFPWPEDGCLRPYSGGGGNSIPNVLRVTDGLLWLLGFYLAEGCCYSHRGTHFISFCSNEEYLDRAETILQREWLARTGRAAPTTTHGPLLYAHSQLLTTVFQDIFGLKGKSAQRHIPAWILQLPLSRLKYFLEGYREGDGTHSGSLMGKELAFNTVSRHLTTDLTYLLLRFGIVASVGQYETTYKARYGERKFPFYRLTVCAVDNFDILSWDQGVQQTLNATRWGDLVWATVSEIRPVQCTEKVYDFSVPGAENFVAGMGVFAHNTYGPRMRLDDGRVVPNFIRQALRGEPLTVYDDGSRTRSFCHVSDLVDGLFRLLCSDYHGPVNLGNPREMTILEFAKRILAATGSPSPIEFVVPTDERTRDDPNVRQPDITLARKILGWDPVVPLEDGLARTIPWFRQKMEKEGRL